jgi:glycosyltransferase involved in cell wall biosynthesis
MNIILLTKKFGPEGLYHWNILDTFNKLYNVHMTGPGFSNYFPGKHINDIIRDSGMRPDIIIFGTSQKIYECEVPGLAELRLPKLIFLNKEFINVNAKLEYIKRHKFDLVSTILNKDIHKPLEDACGGIPFIHIPHGIDPIRFRPLDIEKKYDFGFLGALFTQRDVKDRARVKEILFKESELAKHYKILWADDVNKLFFKGEAYIEALNSCKMFLSTLSPMGIIGTRFYELSACKTMMIAPRGEYDGDFVDKKNIIMFDDNKDFVKKFMFYLENDEARNAIAERAYRDAIDNHTWDARIKKLMAHIFDEDGQCKLVV